MQEFDVIIVGAGMVGASAANLLAPSGLNIAVIEAHLPSSFSFEQEMDLRVSAISLSSQQLLVATGAWSNIREMRICPYRRLETWEQGGSGTKFSAVDIGYDKLGYIIENRVIQLGLLEAMKRHSNVQLFCPEKVAKLEQDALTTRVTLDSGKRLQAKLVLAADGANSLIRQQAHIGINSWDYRQHCMLININTQLPQQDITWQEFAPTGPMAFLPLPGHKASLVWYHQAEQIDYLSRLSKAALKAEIQQHFPDLVGEFDITNHGSFPLVRRHAQQYYKGRVVLLGDAAHTINPLAGQGVNIGFKDVKVLCELIRSAVIEGDAWDSQALLQQYQRSRRPDNMLMQTSMDLFYSVFSNHSLPVKLLRNVGLTLADRAGPLKRQALRYAIGMS
jgi:2-octaprenyl-3-methyl-6-methoxy-1,4-benzoquinol hydroxylase